MKTHTIKVNDFLYVISYGENAVIVNGEEIDTREGAGEKEQLVTALYWIKSIHHNCVRQIDEELNKWLP
jgi:hypothetical protein